MAQLDTPVLRCFQGDVHAIPVKFTMDGTNAPTVLEGNKVISSFSRTSQGLWVITFKHPWYAVMSEALSLRIQNPTTPRWLQPVSDAINTKGGGTYTFRIVDATGAVQDAAAAGSNLFTVCGLFMMKQNGLAS